MDLATEIVQLTDGLEPHYVGTLAATYAENGRFAEAVGAARAAVELSDKAGNQPLSASLKDQLAAYQAGRPFRDPRLPPRAVP